MSRGSAGPGRARRIPVVEAHHSCMLIRQPFVEVAHPVVLDRRCWWVSSGTAFGQRTLVYRVRLGKDRDPILLASRRLRGRSVWSSPHLGLCLGDVRIDRVAQRFRGGVFPTPAERRELVAAERTI